MFCLSLKFSKLCVSVLDLLESICQIIVKLVLLTGECLDLSILLPNHLAEFISLQLVFFQSVSESVDSDHEINNLLGG
jgi:hypothetical protein